MFFDDASQRKPAGRVQLRLAADRDTPGDLNAGERESEAVRRHRAARLRRAPSGPSLLDQIDAISARQAIAEQDERLRADELAAEMDARDAMEAAVLFQRQPRAAKSARQFPTESRDEPSPEPFRDDRAERGHYHDSSGNEDAAPLIDPRYVFRSVRDWRALIAATSMLGGLAGLYVALNTPHLYFSSATVVIDPRNYKVIENDLNPDVFLSEAALAIVDSQVSLMSSPRVLEKVASKLRLANDPEFNGSKQGGIGSFLNLLSSSSVENYDGSALNYLAEHMSAERSPKTFVVNVGAYSEDPQKAALIANTIVDVYLDEQAQTRSDLANRTSGELGSRLESLKAKVEDAESKVETFRSQNDLFGAQGRLIGDEEILRVNDQLTAARSNTITLNSRAQSAKSVTVDAVASGGLPEEVASSGLTALRAQYVAAKQNRDGLSVKLGPMHPDLQQADKALASLSSAINGEINRIRQSLQTDLKRAVETEQKLAARLAQLKVEQGKSGEAQVQLRELEREAVTARTVYEQYLLRARETGEQGNINANNVQKISEARAADTPEGASRKLIVIGGAIAGLFVGLGLAISKGMFDALKARFVSGDGAPAPDAPRAPKGGSPRRRLGGLFSRHSIQPAAWRGATPAGAQPEISLAPQFEKPAQVPQVQQPQTPLPAAQPHQAAMQQVPAAVPMQIPVAFAPQPFFMQPSAQPWPPQPAQPVFQHPQMMPNPQVQHYCQPQPVPMPYPQMAQPLMPVLQPLMSQWQPAPIMEAQQHPVSTAQLDPPAMPIRRTGATVHPHDIQANLNELRAELLEIARRRRSA